jgi:hypothetical protein
LANKYGEAALLAAGDELAPGLSVESRWNSAMHRVYPTSATSRKKTSPRGAFLGLCEEGLVKDIPAGKYSATKDNKDYAVNAVALLIAGTQRATVTDLWRAVASPDKPHDSQMDVVLALWKNDRIVR